ncbi:cysteine proteinase inhibitor 5-like [Vicia villosa]|uniref:cysteine proteinase inhibitor 5-like n=1 Tax=Vicia villosa TaxID=3911 RepID=UPI00273BF8ED|nr:cysteine proteinase inhibitor 5-like [Vicia villosa]
MKLHTLSLLTVLLMVSASTKEEHRMGRYWPITDIDDPDVIKAAKFAVTEYNKQSGFKLKFKKVIKGESQEVAGINYNLTLSAGKGSVLKMYEAVVWERDWLHFRSLTYFKPLH